MPSAPGLAQTWSEAFSIGKKSLPQTVRPVRRDRLSPSPVLASVEGLKEREREREVPKHSKSSERLPGTGGGPGVTRPTGPGPEGAPRPKSPGPPPTPLKQTAPKKTSHSLLFFVSKRTEKPKKYKKVPGATRGRRAGGPPGGPRAAPSISTTKCQIILRVSRLWKFLCQPQCETSRHPDCRFFLKHKGC